MTTYAQVLAAVKRLIKKWRLSDTVINAVNVRALAVNATRYIVLSYRVADNKYGCTFAASETFLFISKISFVRAGNNI